ITLSCLSCVVAAQLSSLIFILFCSSFFFSSRRRHTRSKRDWSSDVCSSDLSCQGHALLRRVPQEQLQQSEVQRYRPSRAHPRREIGRASCRERVEGSEGAGACKKKKRAGCAHINRE